MWLSKIGYRSLYACNIIHRDIKQENVLLHNRLYKIADFGLSIFREELEQKIQSNEPRWAGTFLTMSPEIANAQVQYSNKVDVFSFGVIIYQLMFPGRKNPYLSSLNLDDSQIKNEILLSQ